MLLLTCCNIIHTYHLLLDMVMMNLNLHFKWVEINMVGRNYSLFILNLFSHLLVFPSLFLSQLLRFFLLLPPLTHLYSCPTLPLPLSCVCVCVCVCPSQSPREICTTLNMCTARSSRAVEVDALPLPKVINQSLQPGQEGLGWGEGLTVCW